MPTLPQIRYGLDVLETFRRNKLDPKESMTYVSAPLDDAIAKLSVLVECHHHLQLQRWSTKLEHELMKDEKAKEVSKQVSVPTSAWDTIFKKTRTSQYLHTAIARTAVAILIPSTISRS
jgi:hypothetical protein